MSGVTDGSGTSSMTLAFTLDAISRFPNPGAIVADAREWSRQVGVVANDADAVATFVDRHDVTQDFDLGDQDIWQAMAEISEAVDTQRCVLVGVSPEDRRIAQHTGWEFIHVAEAAEKADWDLHAGVGQQASVVERLREWLSW